MALVLTNVQSLIISLLAAGGKITCKGPLNPGLRAMCKLYHYVLRSISWEYIIRQKFGMGKSGKEIALIAVATIKEYET